MKRWSLAVVLLAVTAFPLPTAAQTITLKLSHFVPPVAPPQPKANQMPAFFGLVEVDVGSAAMHNDAVVQDLNLATLHPKVVTVARIAQEPIEQAHGLGPLIV